MTEGPRPPNLLVVVLDCVRAKSLGSPGAHPVARTPHLDDLARRGVAFPQAIAPGNWTVPSHMSIFTGAMPWVHSLRTFARGTRQLPKIASWLAARDYETAIFTEEVHLVAGYGLEEGYAHQVARRLGTSDDERTISNRLFGHSEFVYSSSVRRAIERMPRLAIPLSALNFRQEAAFKREVSGEYLGEQFGAWLDRRSPARPFHAFFNFVDAHEPYPELVPRPYWGASARGFVQVPRFYLLAIPEVRRRMPWALLEQAYLRSIERADAKVGALLDTLERHGERDRTFVVVTADHGQSFGEAGNVYHGCGATDSVLRVPLIAQGPGIAIPGHRVDRWVSLCEIPSWLKSIALGLEPFDEHGIAPVPFPATPPSRETVLAEGGPASDPNRSLRGIGEDQRWNHRLVAAFRGPEKWIWDTATRDIWHWSGGDPDASPAELIGEPDRESTLRRVFDVRGLPDLQRFLGEATRIERPPLMDARLRSWGYD